MSAAPGNDLFRDAEASARAEGGAALAWYEEWAEAFEEARAAGDESQVDCFTEEETRLAGQYRQASIQRGWNLWTRKLGLKPSR